MACVCLLLDNYTVYQRSNTLETRSEIKSVGSEGPGERSGGACGKGNGRKRVPVRYGLR